MESKAFLLAMTKAKPSPNNPGYRLRRTRAEHKETTTYSQSNNTYTELSKKEENYTTVTPSSKSLIKGEVALIVGAEVSIDWNKAAKAVSTFIENVK